MAPAAPAAPPTAPARLVRDARWDRAARRARQLSWASLVWMTLEGIVGLVAGVEANSLSLLVWAASSFVEGLASMTIIWRFTGSRLHSQTSERTARRWVAGSFLLLVPVFRGCPQGALLVGERAEKLGGALDVHNASRRRRRGGESELRRRGARHLGTPKPANLAVLCDPQPWTASSRCVWPSSEPSTSPSP